MSHACHVQEQKNFKGEAENHRTAEGEEVEDRNSLGRENKTEIECQGGPNGATKAEIRAVCVCAHCPMSRDASTLGADVDLGHGERTHTVMKHRVPSHVELDGCRTSGSLRSKC